jgi:DNA-3-methyladenine glycosylase II
VFFAVVMTLAESKSAAREIIQINPRFQTVIERAGFCRIGMARPTHQRESNFASLASSIISQQLSTKAAATIIRRVEELSGGTLQAKKLALLPASTLRKAGCSEAKTRALRQLALATVNREIPMQSLHRLDDEEIMSHLLPQFGIGKWTVEMFLMFQLGRQDVWPVGDLGVRRGWEKVHRMRNEIEPKTLHKLGAVYSPYRSHLAWYCWRALEVL